MLHSVWPSASNSKDQHTYSPIASSVNVVLDCIQFDYIHWAKLGGTKSGFEHWPLCKKLNNWNDQYSKEKRKSIKNLTGYSRVPAFIWPLICIIHRVHSKPSTVPQPLFKLLFLGCIILKIKIKIRSSSRWKKLSSSSNQKNIEVVFHFQKYLP